MSGILALLPQREREILTRRAQGEKWAKIAEVLDVTPVRAQQLHIQALHRVEELKLGPPERFGERLVVDKPTIIVAS